MVMLCLSIPVSAYDFEVDGIAYTITSLTDLTVSVEKLINVDLTEVYIPENVEYKSKHLKVSAIENSAFKGRRKLNAINLPNTIVTIGSSAFENASALTIITLPESVEYIGADAFSGCTSITTLNIPKGIEQIRPRTFYGCKSLISINLNSNIKSIGAAAFKNSGLQSITIPSSVTLLGESAFAGTPIESILLPNGIEVIPENCFSDCLKLSQVSLSSSTISSEAFRNCSALQQISLPENLTTIGDRAFEGCTNLVEFSIPPEVISIEPTILWDCPNISKLTIGKSLKGLPVYANNDYSSGGYSYQTLGGYYSYDPGFGIYGPYIKDEIYLQGVKEFVIEDSNTEFSIKGFQINNNTCTPPFANTDLDYYYVGRPLVDITKWSSNTGSNSFTVKIKQGTGRINKLEVNGNCTSVPYFYQKVNTLKLGTNIKVFNLANIYKDDLVKIECLSETPPVCTNTYYNFPTKVYTDAILCVPFGCKQAYANAEIWKNFWNIVEAEVGSGILDIIDDGSLKTYYQVYDLKGLLILKSDNASELRKLPKGIYIVSKKNNRYKIKI